MMRKDFVTSSSYNRAIAAKPRRTGIDSSTAQDSYKTHTDDAVKDEFQNDKSAYVTNKSKARCGGEWWGDGVQTAPSSQSNYASSFNKGGDSPTAGQAGGDEWMQHRRKKQIGTAGEKRYDILTGTETDRPATGWHDPGKSAKRVSIEKMNTQAGGGSTDGRTFNIISNMG